MRVLVTGAAGFIGSHVSRALLDAGHSVVGVDNLNAYYDTGLKRARLSALSLSKRFRFERIDLGAPGALDGLEGPFDRVVHLAAQAGVRYSMERPFDYADSNVHGHLAVLEYCRRAASPPLLIYASSSSVYGMGAPTPFREDGPLGRPASLYAATKRADELMSDTYASLYGVKQIGLRFFTVYGPWGRPDMAYWLFTEKILAGQPIQVFNSGDLSRDFTFIGDVTGGVMSVVEDAPRFADPARPHRIYNIGSGRPTPLLDFIRVIEACTGRVALCDMHPMQPGDVAETWADISAITQDYGYSAPTSLAEGLGQFVDWLQTQTAGKIQVAGAT